MRIRNLKLISIKDFVTLSKKMSDRTKIRYPHPLWIVSANVLLCTTQNEKRRIICHSLNKWKKETEWKSAIQPNARKILIIYHVKKCSWMRIFARNDREWLKAWWFYVSNSQLCFTQTMLSKNQIKSQSLWTGPLQIERALSWGPENRFLEILANWA